MKIVGLDTSHRTLTIALIDGDRLIYSYQKDAFKAQSETIMVELDQAFKRIGWKPKDLQAMVITDGPGSYTGIRIAMTIAKVICQQASLPLYTVSSLRLLAGSKGRAAALMDARGKRAYFGLYRDGKIEVADCVLPIDEIAAIIASEVPLYGDVGLSGKIATIPDLAQRFLDIKEYWTLVENIHTLQPRYLKETEVHFNP